MNWLLESDNERSTNGQFNKNTDFASGFLNMRAR